MGEWVKRKQDEHNHDMPLYLDTKAAVGDRWLCVCGKTFEISVLTYHPDFGQREPAYQTAKWERVV